jgi:predicted amidohydrolase YtcJ
MQTMQKTVLAAAALFVLAACSPEPSPDVSEAPAAAAAEAPEGADLILLNARVYSLSWPEPAGDGTLSAQAPHDENGWGPDAEAIVIDDGLIVYVGERAAAEEFQGTHTRVIDAGGATALPGLVDSHTHIFNLGASLTRVSLYDVDTEEEAVERIVAKAADVPEGEWIVGHGWDEGAWANRYPDMTLLSERVPNHPVYMRSLHSFAGWGNKLAFERAGITADTPVPSGGEIRLFEDGTPNGLLLNRAVPLLEDAIPMPSREQLTERVLLALNQMAADGYVTVHDAGLGAEEMAILETLEAEGRLPIRVYAMLSARDEALSRAWIAKGPDTDNDSFLVTRSVKAFYDGALGSRGARLLADYSDRPGHRGVSGGEYGFDQALVREMMLRGFQVGVHAIGDAGNRETLDFIAGVNQQDPASRALRHRIEHAQVIHPDDIARFADERIIASMEPPHAVEDKTWAEDRLGPQRILGAYAWRSLRQAGVGLTCNADNPGSDHSIFYGMHAAMTRRDKDRQPAEGWYPEQNMNADETVRAYTQWSAFAGFRENETGVLAEGRWADLTLMDIDPFVLSQTDSGAILDGRIMMTIVDGKPVFEAEGL